MDYSNWQTASNIVILLGFIITGLGGFGQYYFSKKIEEEKDAISKEKEKSLNGKVDDLLTGNNDLKEKLKPFEQIALLKYPGENTNDALENLKKDFERLNLEVKKETQIIKQLSTRLQVKILGECPNYASYMISPVNHQYYVAIGEEETNKTAIKFYATETYRFKKLNDDITLFQSSQAVKDGLFPLGQSIEKLKDYQTITIHIPFLSKNNSAMIKIGEVILEFFVNGEKRGEIREAFDANINVVGPSPNNIYANAVITVTENFIYELIKK